MRWRFNIALAWSVETLTRFLLPRLCLGNLGNAPATSPPFSLSLEDDGLDGGDIDVIDNDDDDDDDDDGMMADACTGGHRGGNRLDPRTRLWDRGGRPIVVGIVIVDDDFGCLAGSGSSRDKT